MVSIPEWNDQSNQGQETDQDNTNLNVGGGSGSTVGGGGSGGQPSGPQGSGSWTNLQSYTNANQDQANTMSNQIRGNLQDARAGVGEDIKQSTTAYNDYLSGGTTDATAQKAWWDKVRGGYTPDQNEITDMSAKGWYTPGQDPTAYDASSPSTDAYNQRLQATNTERGRMNELKRLQGDQATRGEGQLNQLLMQNSQGAKDMFEQQRGTMSDVEAQQAKAANDAKAQREQLQALQGQAVNAGTFNDLQGQYDAQVNQQNLQGLKSSYDTQQAALDKLKSDYNLQTTQSMNNPGTTTGYTAGYQQWLNNLLNQQSSTDAAKTSYDTALSPYGTDYDTAMGGYDENRMSILKQLANQGNTGV